MALPHDQHGSPVSRESDNFSHLRRLVADASVHRSSDRGVSAMLPLMKRVLETGRGPASLLRWVSKAKSNRRTLAPGEQLARVLSEELVESLLGRRDCQAETIRGL